MKNKVIFSLICFLIVLLFGGLEFLSITANFYNYQTDSERIEIIQKNVDNNYKEVLEAYNDVVSLEYVNEINLCFDKCNYEIKKEGINVWKGSEREYLNITYGINNGKLYIKDIYNHVIQHEIFVICLLAFFALSGVFLICLNYKKFIKKDE